MKVLVTGGAGYIGAMTCARLLDAGMDVTVFDKLVYGGEALLGLRGHRGFRLAAGDIRDEAAFTRALDGASAVVHLAAIVGEPACASDPDAAWSINFDGTRLAIAAAANHRVERFLLVSTCSNYGVSAPDVLADETTPVKPLSRYAESKVEAERLALEGTHGIGACVLRFGTICGLSPRMRFDLLVNEMARSAALREPIEIFAPGAWRPFLHVRDAADAIAFCLSAPAGGVHGKMFNIVGENCQKQGLIDLTLKHYPSTRIAITPRQPDLRDYRVSGERIRRELGFSPRYSVEDAFLETADAVASGVFRDPKWFGHAASPLDTSRLA